MKLSNDFLGVLRVQRVILIAIVSFKLMKRYSKAKPNAPALFTSAASCPRGCPEMRSGDLSPVSRETRERQRQTDRQRGGDSCESHIFDVYSDEPYFIISKILEIYIKN